MCLEVSGLDKRTVVEPCVNGLLVLGIMTICGETRGVTGRTRVLDRVVHRSKFCTCKNVREVRSVFKHSVGKRVSNFEECSLSRNVG
jgi:hypothetical protein